MSARPAGTPARDASAAPHPARLSALSEALRVHVEQLAGRIGERNVGRPDALHAAAEYIRVQWERQGHVVSAQGFPVDGVGCENLEVAREGDDAPGRILVVGAHYDSVAGAPGADDNASAVAALIEIGRTIAGARTRRTVKLVAFANEEPPYFFTAAMGSRVYARAARRRGDDIRVMLSLEMLGYYDEAAGSQAYPPLLRFFYPDRGNFIAFVSNLRSRRQLRELVAAFRARSDFPAEQLAAPPVVPGIALSDQLSFWREGYPAIMVTDTAFYRNPHYHTRADTPDTLDYARMARVVDGLSGAILDLANVAD